MLTVGQELWMVPRERHLGQPRFVKVVKVGRKWAELDCLYRVNMETLSVDGGGYTSPARCYLDKEAYEAEQERQRLWGVLRQRINNKWTAPDGVTVEQIKIAAAELNLLAADETA